MLPIVNPGLVERLTQGTPSVGRVI